jgi:hypothetical protein
MLAGLRSLWEPGIVPPPTPPVISAQVGFTGPGGFAFAGTPRKKKKPWGGPTGPEIDEDELEELLAMLGIDI